MIANPSTANAFLAMCEQNGIPAPTFEYRFHSKRRWRFDAAWPAHQIALEVEGGVWTNGRHTRGSGFVRDMEKYNAAAVLGWRLLRVVPDDLFTTDTVWLIREAICD